MALAFLPFFHAISSVFQPRERIICFHCDEKFRKDLGVMAQFNGGSQLLCCHACLAVLQTIERNGMTEEYLLAKSRIALAEAAP